MAVTQNYLQGLKEVTTKRIFDVLDEYKSAGKLATASNIRSCWIDMYQEAQYAGEVDSGFNPPATTRKITVPVKRKRITETDFAAMVETPLFHSCLHLRIAMKIAVTTGLRREDIVNLKFSDIKDGFLFVSLSKSNGKTKLAFPLELTNPVIGESLGEIVKECRSSRIVSRYLIHSTRNIKGGVNTKKGMPIKPDTISVMFKRAKSQVTNEDVASKNISFHELRSFAERTYRDAGYDTKTLLGHKNQTTTDGYNDDRKDDFTFIQIPSGRH